MVLSLPSTSLGSASLFSASNKRFNRLSVSSTIFFTCGCGIQLLRPSEVPSTNRQLERLHPLHLAIKGLKDRLCLARHVAPVASGYWVS